MNETLYIPDLVGAVVQKVDQTFWSRPTNPFHVYYEFGHHEEVLRQLIYKEGNPDKPKKYPLIWLVTPFKEVKKEHGLYAETKLHIVIAYYTSNTYSMAERRDNVFKPILYPVYAELLRQLQKSYSFQMQSDPVHTKMDLQYAKVDSDNKNLFNDFVDVIDITDLEIIVKNICTPS